MKRRGFFGAIVGLALAPFIPAAVAHSQGKRYTETFHMDDIIGCVFDPSTGTTEYIKNGVYLNLGETPFEFHPPYNMNGWVK